MQVITSTTDPSSPPAPTRPVIHRLVRLILEAASGRRRTAWVTVAHEVGSAPAVIQTAACARYRQLRPADFGTRIVAIDIHAASH
jgi:hypothetical protein